MRWKELYRIGKRASLSRLFCHSAKLKKTLLDELLQKGFVRLGKVERVAAIQARQAVMERYHTVSSSFLFRVRRALGLDNVNSPQQRFSIALRLCPDIASLLKEVCGGSKERQQFFQELVGPDAVLVELSALLTFPSASQVSYFRSVTSPLSVTAVH